MTDYLYDGTFEGLLTCIYHHYYTERAQGIYRKDEYQPTFLNGCTEIVTDPVKATAVYEAIEKKISTFDLRRIYKAFLFDDGDKETKILKYVVLGFRVGARLSSLHGDPAVFDVQAMEKKIDVERERLLQFVRFSAMEGGVLYAEIEPDNDILELAAGHFCDRYRNDPFIINDVRRKKAMIACGGSWYMTSLDEADVPDVSADEKAYRRMWKDYFENIAIKERKNPRCQRRFMPERYWKHLTEMSGI